MFNLEEELKNLPKLPGVYLMHNSGGEIIYVGKAKILRNRVRQYFQNSANHTPKVRAMVSYVAYFEYIVTDSETEALVLECNLIKKHRPKYNVLLKDDKHYPYLKVTINEDYPRIMITRELKNDGAKYFGPYMGINTIKNTLDIIQKIFKPPTCKRKFPEDIGRGRPCLNYHIKNCFAPCMGNVTKEEYKKVFLEICSFLDGNKKQLLSQLEKEMKKKSEEFQYEAAAVIRDKIKAVHNLSEKQKIINSDSQTDLDIIAAHSLEDKTFVEVFFVRMGKVIGRENYSLDQTKETEQKVVMEDFIKQFYLERTNIPPLILTQWEIEDKDAISFWLTGKRGRKVTISSPKRGEKKKLLEMVRKNAEIAANNWQIKRLEAEKKHNIGEKFASLTGLMSTPQRIEAYDVSNISGADNVSAMVVFEKGVPKKSKYRKFKIKSFEGSDDYAAMKETLYRRFLRALTETEAIQKGEIKEEDAKFLPYPDVILIDGGRGHLAAALEILSQMEIDIPVFGMVKDDKHRTRGLVSKDGEVAISAVSEVFNFITRIQDEVHKTAISYHRNLHKKGMTTSELDNIKGIGEKRRKALLSRFKSIEGIKNASVEEIMTVDGMNRKISEEVKRHFEE